MLLQIHQRPQGISPLVSGTAEIITVLANPTTDQDVLEEAPDSPVASSNGDTRDTEQPGSLEMQMLHLLSIETPKIWSSQNTNRD